MLLCLVFTLTYFPSRPRYAPTATAVTARLEFLEARNYFFSFHPVFLFASS